MRREDVKNTYWPSDLGRPDREDREFQEKLGAPGEYPYTRGVQKNMYRGRLWTMRQYAGFGSAEESNARYHYLLSQGTMGLSVAFDLPTQLGYDPDHLRSRGEVGRVGVSLSTLDEMRTLFRGIPMAQVSTSMTINATAAILLAFYTVVAEEQGAPLQELRGTLQNDILKEYIARGNYIYPAKGALRLTTDLFEWCTRVVPKWNPISISGYHIREAGSTAVQELAFTFANAIAYVDAAVQQGLQVDTFAGQLSFFFNVHNDFFEEIAKFRAARRIWARIMRERFGAKDPKSQMLRFHSQTAGSTLTAQQPQNNAVRVAIQALASVLGGTQSLHTNAIDEALGLPTEDTARLALRTQQVIAAESGVTQVVDPLGGSWWVESETDRLERETFALIESIDSKGGTVRCIETGFIQGEILNAAYRAQLEMEKKELQVVGVNCYTEKENTRSIQGLKLSPDSERAVVERVKAYKARRSLGALNEALSALEATARTGKGNLQDQIVACVRKEATLGEIAGRLREVYGEYKAPF